jgi:nucleoside-diphosphate-sugar epimerase
LFQKPLLLIGGAGYIGSSLLPKLLQQGWHVRLMDVFLYGRDAIEPWLAHPNIDIIEADFRQIDSLVKAMQGVSQVIHLGGIVGDPACRVDEELTIDVNLAATRAIAEVAKSSAARKLIFASSCSVYGASGHLIDENSDLNPVSLYAKTKIASEKILLSMQDPNFNPIILRLSTVYGISGRTRFDLVVNLLSAKAMIDRVITVVNGDQWRPFIHVDDVARAIMAFIDKNNLENTSPIFNVGGDAGNYTIRQVGEVVKRVVPRAELVSFENDEDRRNYRATFQKIRETLGFEPRWTIEEGVRQVVQVISGLNIRDYSESRFSNVKALSESARVLSKPAPNWARKIVASL